MDKGNLIRNFKGTAVYQITVAGEVSIEAMEQLNDFSISHTVLSSKTLSTLSGKIEDQTALRGLINLLANNHYEVISVIKL